MDKLPQVACVWLLLFVFSGCGKLEDDTSTQANTIPATPIDSANTNLQNQSNIAPPNIATSSPIPEETTTSPIGKFDFKNFTYPLPRGWQGTMREITIENGKAPLSMADDARKIGASFVKTKFGDVTGDGQDEAFVILKIETGGSALPQVVYIFEWKNEKPEIIWYFRTGDRADGGLRDLRAENSELIVELYGQDRYIFGDVETMKVMGDEEQLCCPTFYTRNRYKLTANRFVLQGKRETFSIAEPNAPPIENKGDKITEENKKGKR